MQRRTKPLLLLLALVASMATLLPSVRANDDDFNDAPDPAFVDDASEGLVEDEPDQASTEKVLNSRSRSRLLCK